MRGLRPLLPWYSPLHQATEGALAMRTCPLDCLNLAYRRCRAMKEGRQKKEVPWGMGVFVVSPRCLGAARDCHLTCAFSLPIIEKEARVSSRRKREYHREGSASIIEKEARVSSRRKREYHQEGSASIIDKEA